MLVTHLNGYRYGNFGTTDRVLCIVQASPRLKTKYEEQRNGRQERQEFIDRRSRLEQLTLRASKKLPLFEENDE